MKKLSCALAFALMALVAMPGTPRNAVEAHAATSLASVTALAPIAAAPVSVDVAKADVTVVRLSEAEMEFVQGNGWWKKVVKWVKKQAKWVWDHREEIITIIETLIEIFGSTGQGNPDQTDNFEVVEETNNYYGGADGTQFLGSTFESSGEVYQGTEYSGGGEDY